MKFDMPELKVAIISDAVMGIGAGEGYVEEEEM